MPQNGSREGRSRKSGLRRGACRITAWNADARRGTSFSSQQPFHGPHRRMPPAPRHRKRGLDAAQQATRQACQLDPPPAALDRDDPPQHLIAQNRQIRLGERITLRHQEKLPSLAERANNAVSAESTCPPDEHHLPDTQPAGRLADDQQSISRADPRPHTVAGNPEARAALGAQGSPDRPALGEIEDGRHGVQSGSCSWNFAFVIDFPSRITSISHIPVSACWVM